MDDGIPLYEVSFARPVLNMPESYAKDPSWDDALSLAIRYRGIRQVQIDVIIEDIVIEYWPRTLDESFSGDRQVIVGIPLPIYEWILQKAINVLGKHIGDVENPFNEDYVWLKDSSVRKNKGKNNSLCYIYDKDKSATVPIGNLKQVCNNLKSNLLGYGQFAVTVTKANYLEFFLTGFQLVNTTAIQSLPKPEIEVSLPDSIITAMELLSLH